MNSVQVLILFFLLFMMLMYLSKENTVVENWEIYRMFPYGEVKTCPDVYNNNCSFYEYKRYRKPYMWPSKHWVEYPIPHFQNLDKQFY